MSFLADVVTHLANRGVNSALIGAAALAIHGVARATEDLDLLVMDMQVLVQDAWKELRGVEHLAVQKGDAEDPLAGLVRLQAGEAIVEIVIGKGSWMRDILDRRISVTVRSERIPVVDAADLILLKLYAGGPQDLLDARLLLANDPKRLRPDVEARLARVPASVATAWQELLRRAD